MQWIREKRKMRDKALILSAPYIIASENSSKLCCDITCSDRSFTAWFEVTSEYSRYLTADRLDAFAVVFLPLAMRENADMICKAPVSPELIYQINHYLTPVLGKNIKEYNAITLNAKPAGERIQSEGAAGTGWTGGVDSMYTLKTRLKASEPHMRLTHLVIANIGTLESSDNEGLLDIMVKRAEAGICADTGLKCVGINSNLDTVLPENYLAVAGYRLPAAVLALQGLFSVFYHSGAYEFDTFTFAGENSAYYEMFLLPCLSTDATVFYSSGSSISRIEKLKELSDYPYAEQYLHPCIYAKTGKNCGKCGKCIRTIAALYTLGTLDRFDKVFDTSDFYNNKDHYLANVISNRHRQHYKESYDMMTEKGLITVKSMQLSKMQNAAKIIADRNRSTLEKVLGKEK